MSRKVRVFASILTGILLTPAWYTHGHGFILFIAFIPLFFVEADLYKQKVKSKGWFWLPFLAFFVFNLLATWWIKNASFAGLIAALIVNTTMMTIPFWLFTITHRKLGEKTGYISLIVYWLAMEYFYLHAEISWTWLNLGNGFANNIRFIQWYEYTGTLGGSLWVLLMNILIFRLIKKFRQKKDLKAIYGPIAITALALLFPVIISLIRFYNYEEEEKPYEVVVVQPNIDPYLKFNDVPVEEQLEIFFRIADSVSSPETDYIVAPETFINNQIWINDMHGNSSIKKLENFSRKYPGANLIIGITSYKLYDKENATPTSRPFRGNRSYDSFNTGIQIDTTGNIQFYHKSQLVVGVEKMPYTQYLGFLKKLMLHLGGTFRSHGIQDYRDSFINPRDSVKVAPVICYESIFGEYVTEYVKDAGANLIFVITNDGWWGDTPGYIQHNSFSALRAIENRRSVARSANTGISSFFNQKGEILDHIDWWERSGIKSTLNANDQLTFYTKHGDYIGRISSFLAIAILLYTLVGFILKKKSE